MQSPEIDSINKSYSHLKSHTVKLSDISNEFLHKFLEKISIYSGGILSVSLTVFLALSEKLEFGSIFRRIILFYLVFFIISLVSSIFTNWIYSYYIIGELWKTNVEAEMLLNNGKIKYEDQLVSDPVTMKPLNKGEKQQMHKNQEEYSHIMDNADKYTRRWYFRFTFLKIVCVISFALGMIGMIIICFYVSNSLRSINLCLE